MHFEQLECYEKWCIDIVFKAKILNRTPLSKKTTEEELRDKIKIKGNVYL